MAAILQNSIYNNVWHVNRFGGIFKIFEIAGSFGKDFRRCNCFVDFAFEFPYASPSGSGETGLQRRRVTVGGGQERVEVDRELFDKGIFLCYKVIRRLMYAN